MAWSTALPPAVHAVHAYQGCAQAGGRQDSPDHEYRRDDGVLWLLLAATRATVPVIPAPTLTPARSARLPGGGIFASGRAPDEPARSLASTRLSISAPIRSIKLFVATP